tara:strand:- start:448 stop:699 length:252 start_codon:yes stop_codon:yes gene_type:complete
MNFFRRYRLDIDELLNELKVGSQDKKISPPEDFAAKVMKSLDDTSKNSRSVLLRFLAFALLLFITIFVVIIMRNRSTDKSEDE